MSDASELIARATARLEALSPEAGLCSPAQVLAPPFRPLSPDEISSDDPYAIYDRLGAHRLREGLTLAAREQGAEILMQVDDDWIAEQGLPIAEDATWSSIDSWDDGGSWWLLREELEPALSRYLEAHRAAIITS